MNTTHLLLAMALIAGLALPVAAAPLPDDLRGEDEETEKVPDPENRYLPPEIREDLERPAPVATAQPLPGESDADDGTSEPEPPPSPEAPTAESPQPEAPPAGPRPVRPRTKVKVPGAEPRKAQKAWKRPPPPANAHPGKHPVVADVPRVETDDDQDRRRLEREARRDAAEVDRLNREAERKAAAEAKRKAREVERKARRAARNTDPAGAHKTPPDTRTAALSSPPGTPAGAPAVPSFSNTGSDATLPAPVPLPAPAASGRPKKDKKSAKTPPAGSAGATASGASGAAGAPAPGGSGPDAAPGGAGSERGSRGKSGKSRRRGGEYGRTGEEAPVVVASKDRTAVAPLTQSQPYVDTLKTMLVSLVDAARNPMERDIALAYLGYLGEKSRLPKMYERVDDPKVEDGEKLPVIAALVDGYDDRTRVPLLHRIADDPKAAPFQKLWALEVLAQAQDRSRIAVAQRLIDDKETDANDRMRALSVLAQLGDDSRRDVARKLGKDADLFLATRMQALGCLARMEKNASKGSVEGTSELKRVMNRSHLSVEERLSIALDLCQLGDASTRDFFERVVEQEADSVFEQLRALHGLAVMGVSEHLGLLQETFNTRKRTRNTARRILVMMGDRSHVADLLDDSRAGDLEAVRTLVLAAVLDAQKSTAAVLLKQPRYKSLIAP